MLSAKLSYLFALSHLPSPVFRLPSSIFLHRVCLHVYLSVSVSQSVYLSHCPTVCPPALCWWIRLCYLFNLLLICSAATDSTHPRTCLHMFNMLPLMPLNLEDSLLLICTSVSVLYLYLHLDLYLYTDQKNVRKISASTTQNS